MNIDFTLSVCIYINGLYTSNRFGNQKYDTELIVI